MKNSDHPPHQSQEKTMKRDLDFLENLRVIMITEVHISLVWANTQKL